MVSEQITAIASPASTVGASVMVMVSISLASGQGAAAFVVNVSM